MPLNLSPDLSTPSFLFRFDIFIPVVFNNGSLVPPTYFDDLTKELADTFGGASANYPYGGAGGIDGMWYSSVSDFWHHDNCAIIMVLAKGEPASIEYFRKNLPLWEKKFKQDKILIIVQKIQSL